MDNNVKKWGNSVQELNLKLTTEDLLIDHVGSISSDVTEMSFNKANATITQGKKSVSACNKNINFEYIKNLKTKHLQGRTLLIVNSKKNNATKNIQKKLSEPDDSIEILEKPNDVRIFDITNQGISSLEENEFILCPKSGQLIPRTCSSANEAEPTKWGKNLRTYSRSDFAEPKKEISKELLKKPGITCTTSIECTENVDSKLLHCIDKSEASEQCHSSCSNATILKTSLENSLDTCKQYLESMSKLKSNVINSSGLGDNANDVEMGTSTVDPNKTVSLRKRPNNTIILRKSLPEIRPKPQVIVRTFNFPKIVPSSKNKDGHKKIQTEQSLSLATGPVVANSSVSTSTNNKGSSSQQIPILKEQNGIIKDKVATLQPPMNVILPKNHIAVTNRPLKNSAVIGNSVLPIIDIRKNDLSSKLLSTLKEDGRVMIPLPSNNLKLIDNTKTLVLISPDKVNGKCDLSKTFSNNNSKLTVKQNLDMLNSKLKTSECESNQSPLVNSKTVTNTELHENGNIGSTESQLSVKNNSLNIPSKQNIALSTSNDKKPFMLEISDSTKSPVNIPVIKSKNIECSTHCEVNGITSDNSKAGSATIHVEIFNTNDQNDDSTKKPIQSVPAGNVQSVGLLKGEVNIHEKEQKMLKMRENIALKTERELRANEMEPKCVRKVVLPAREVWLADASCQTVLFSLLEPGRLVEMTFSKKGQDCGQPYTSGSTASSTSIINVNNLIQENKTQKNDEPSPKRQRLDHDNNLFYDVPQVPAVINVNSVEHRTQKDNFRGVKLGQPHLKFISSTNIANPSNNIDVFSLSSPFIDNARSSELLNVQSAHSVLAADDNIDMTALSKTLNVESTSRHTDWKYQALKDFVLCCQLDEEGNVPLHYAVENQDDVAVKRQCCVLSAKCVPVDIKNERGWTPLHLAVMSGNPKITYILLKFEADPHVRDSEGNTALHLAVGRTSNFSCLKVLLSKRFNRKPLDLDAFNYDGYSALHLCVLNNKIEEIKLLLSKGADVNLRDGRSGRTALFHAVEEGNKIAVRVLMQNGANSMKANFAGHTPLIAADDGILGKQLSSEIITGSVLENKLLEHSIEIEDVSME